MSLSMGSCRGCLQVLLHPLAIVNVSDHATRLKAAQTAEAAGQQMPDAFNSPSFAVGALLGTINNRCLEIHNSFDLQPLMVDGDESEGNGGANESFMIDIDFFELRLAQFKAVLRNMDFVGWYRIDINSAKANASPNWCDDLILAALHRYNKNPYIMLVDPFTTRPEKNRDDSFDLNRKLLPIRIFEKTQNSTNSRPEFRQTDFLMTSGESERIAVDHVVNKGIHGWRLMQASVLANKCVDMEYGEPIDDSTSYETEIDDTGLEKTDSTGTARLPDLPQASLDYVMNLKSTARTVGVLKKRLAVIELYLEGIKSGKVASQNRILSEIATVCNLQSNISLSADFQYTETDHDNDAQGDTGVAAGAGLTSFAMVEEFKKEMLWSEMSMYLAGLTMFTHDLNDVCKSIKLSTEFLRLPRQGVYNPPVKTQSHSPFTVPEARSGTGGPFRLIRGPRLS